MNYIKYNKITKQIECVYNIATDEDILKQEHTDEDDFIEGDVDSHEYYIEDKKIIKRKVFDFNVNEKDNVVTITNIPINSIVNLNSEKYNSNDGILELEYSIEEKIHLIFTHNEYKTKEIIIHED